MINKFRAELGVFLISLSIKVMPKKWRTKNAIKNLITAETIKIKES